MLRRWRSWLCLPWLLALAGCGPGVGGTGTGDQSAALEYFGAKAASVCSASFASQLKCASRVVIGPAEPDPSEGSEPVSWVDDSARVRVSARILDSQAEFEAPCKELRFKGTWGVRPGERMGRFYGYYESGSLQISVPATLTVQPDDGVGSYFVLQDFSGLVLFGPQFLQKVNGHAQAAFCF